VTTRPKLTERWVKETVRWLWGFDLKPFQLADLIALLTGGVISVLYPTDHGKSTLIEMSVVLHVILDPFRANLVIKASPDAAAEFSMVACTLLERAAEKYPWVKPRVRHDQTGTPLPGRGFHVEGGNMANRNKAVMSVSIGARDLQGRRARTHIDDVETMREAMYPRFRELLANRVAATLRTLEDRPDALWAMFGTPYLENTIYYDIVRKLADMGPRHRIIRRPIRDEFGNLLWQERAEKVEMHRRTMSATEWKVAYMLEPITFGKPDPSDVQSMMDTSFSFCASERDFAIWLWGWMQRTFRDEFKPAAAGGKAQGALGFLSLLHRVGPGGAWRLGGRRDGDGGGALFRHSCLQRTWRCVVATDAAGKADSLVAGRDHHHRGQRSAKDAHGRISSALPHDSDHAASDGRREGFGIHRYPVFAGAVEAAGLSFALCRCDGQAMADLVVS
jgi:hypothetical protein